MSDVKALDPALLKQYSTDFNADRANLVAANAAVSSGVLAAATDYKGERVLQNDFSIELKQGSITNQRSSGRCWMFAALNTLRYELMHRWNLEDFEFSETYLFFWDAMEKSNTYLENVLPRWMSRWIVVCSRRLIMVRPMMVVGGRCSLIW